MILVARPSDKRSRSMFILVVIAVISAVYSLAQWSPWAPFSHRADDFVLGVTFGSAIVLGIALFATRGERSGNA